MSVRFKVNMTPKVMYGFMIHHNYTHFMGIFGVAFSVVSIALGINQMNKAGLGSALIFFVIAAVLLVYAPLLLWVQAKRQVKSAAVFQKPLTYEMTETGVKVSQAGSEEETPWSVFTKATSTTQSLILYMDKTRAIIFPKDQMDGQCVAAVEMISTHMPPDRVKIRMVN